MDRELLGHPLGAGQAEQGCSGLCFLRPNLQQVLLVPTRLENSLTTQAPAAEVLQEGGTATDGARH